MSVDLPWSPYDIDGRNYDWAGLAASADILFIMSYDMQSQVREEFHTCPDRLQDAPQLGRQKGRGECREAPPCSCEDR